MQLQDFVARQHIKHPLSNVNNVSCIFDPCERHRSHCYQCRDSKTLLKLNQIKTLFEWCYGFKKPREKNKRFTRRAPSAGAMYPNEIYVLIADSEQWKVLFYDFVTHDFFEVETATANDAAQYMYLSEQHCGVFVVSAFWRTLQRYGLRGYRYCLLDAGAIINNIFLTIKNYDSQFQLTEQNTTSDLENCLDLQYGEGLVFSFSLTENNLRSIQSLPKFNVCNNVVMADLPVRNDVPNKNIVLQQVVEFHNTSLLQKSSAPDLEKLTLSHSTGIDINILDTRHSANEFKQIALELNKFNQLLNTFKNIKQELFSSLPLSIYLIVIDVETVECGVYRIDEYMDKVSSEIWDQADLREFFYRSCQQQEITRNCSLSLVIGTHNKYITDIHTKAYQNTILNAGVYDQEIYVAATQYGVASTCIGGFDDELIAKMIGGRDFYPIVMHIFGIENITEQKVDAAHVYDENSQSLTTLYE